MEDVVKLLERWEMDQKEVRCRMYRAPTARERERWYGLWLLAQGWSATQVAEALERDAHTIGARGLVFEQTGGSPPALSTGQHSQLKSAVEKPPGDTGIDYSNWNWKVVRQFLKERSGHTLSRSSCLNYLHRLGFVVKRPKKRFLKADAHRRNAFVAEYAALLDQAQRVGAKIFFADEAHFRAD